MAAGALLLLSLRMVTLAEAEKQAATQQPTILQAEAQTEVAEARRGESLAPLLPQLSGSALYQRKTGNFATNPGQNPNLSTMGGSTSSGVTNKLDTFNFYNFQLGVNQLIWDFDYTLGRHRAARRNVDVARSSEEDTRSRVMQTVRNAYFTARSQKALVQVASETVGNLQRHLQQIEGFVKVGTRPEIDLAQARTDLANGRVQLITAQNNYEVAKAQLNQAMGVLGGGTDYDVADDGLPGVEGEDGAVEPLVDEAAKGRPDLGALAAQLAGQELLLAAQRGAYLPTLSTGFQVTASGADITAMAYNGALSLSLSWFSGGNPGLALNLALVREARANIAVVRAQLETLQLEVRLEVEQARLSLRAAKAQVAAADEALLNARERLRLAEGRYAAGVGNVIELGDAQVAYTGAAAQKIQYQAGVDLARAQLLRALGRK